MLTAIRTVFYRALEQRYSVQSARFLAGHFTDGPDDAFIGNMILSKLMTNYIRAFLARGNWEQVDYFLRRNCSIMREGEGSKAKLLLCTHTGDYWVSVLMAAREYEGAGIDFVVPIYEAITEENQAMYDLIAIPGVKIIFLRIHDEGALTRVVRHMKAPNSVVAIFYDLYCYSSGIYNGAVEATTLFGRHAHMTTGILQVAQRMTLATSFVSCHYSARDAHFQTEITSPVVLSTQDPTRQEMIAYLESKIRKAPWQWQFISVLDSYYHFPFSELQARHARQQALFTRLNTHYQGHR